MSFSGLINEAVGKFVLRSIRKGTHFSPSKEVVSPSVSLSRFSRCDFHKKKETTKKENRISATRDRMRNDSDVPRGNRERLCRQGKHCAWNGVQYVTFSRRKMRKTKFA